MHYFSLFVGLSFLIACGEASSSIASLMTTSSSSSVNYTSLNATIKNGTSDPVLINYVKNYDLLKTRIFQFYGIRAVRSNNAGMATFIASQVTIDSTFDLTEMEPTSITLIYTPANQSPLEVDVKFTLTTRSINSTFT
jgi:hypothetical protein